MASRTTPSPAPSIAPAPTRVAIRLTCEAVTGCSFAESIALDVWSEQRGAGLPIDIVVAHAELARLDASRVPYEVLVPDLDAAASAESARLSSHAVSATEDFLGDYRDYRAISDHLRELAELAPDRASMQPLGASIEGRPLWALKIGTRADAKPMLINGTQHAREWIAAMVTTCIADRLVRDYDRDPAIRELVDHTAIWVVPVVNPDGYQYTWSTDRYWRKNRRDRTGVDLNRNFSVAWGGAGSSRNARSEVYRGEYAFSEPETIALRDLVKREQIALHVDFHAYGQLLLYPWGYTSAPATDRDRFAAVGDRIASAMFAAHGTRYRLMSAVELYPASGTMLDWMYGEAAASSYTVELRPKGGSGFVLPPSEIGPSCDEGLAAVLELSRAHSLTE
jgi:carboxypeptidase T